MIITYRLDDICPYMVWDNFHKVKAIFDKYNIKPLIGVIPNCKDEKLTKYEYLKDFWPMVKHLQEKGWVVALHGYTHEYHTQNSGILKMWKKSEFAGVPFKTQYTKINKGRAILAGFIGGVSGGLISYFLPFSSAVGVWLGDAFVGFTIALMISLVEEAMREAWITVIWNPKETRNIALGQKPIFFGSSKEADIYIPAKSGGTSPSLYASINIENGQIVFVDITNGQRSVLQNGNEIIIDNLKVLVNTK